MLTSSSDMYWCGHPRHVQKSSVVFTIWKVITVSNAACPSIVPVLLFFEMNHHQSVTGWCPSHYSHGWIQNVTRPDASPLSLPQWLRQRFCFLLFCWYGLWCCCCLYSEVTCCKLSCWLTLVLATIVCKYLYLQWNINKHW